MSQLIQIFLKGNMALKKQLELFFDDLAYYPHCTDDFADGQYRTKKTEAIRKKYIEFNQPCLVSYFVFDLDYPESALAWREENLPEPFWVAQNPKNGHVHICYRLLFPYPTTEIASIKPMQYAAKIQAAMARKLKADAGYSRKLTKNPYNPAWRTMYFTDKSYLL
ncbi:replication initiation protein, partial [Acinetobacter baumannii]|uniref:replication initiation protein n=1 Tax=Acinetobacter baumannii TaxID=470 RepID=UPI0038928F86